MSLEKRVGDLENKFRTHKHSGLDSPAITLELENQGSLTAKDSSTVDTATYSATEAGVIENNRTRIEEIEDALKALGILT